MVLSEVSNLLYWGDPNLVKNIFITFLGTTLFIIEITAVSLSYQELTKDEINIEAHGQLVESTNPNPQ